MQAFVVTLCWVEIAALVVGAAMVAGARGDGDAAGRAMGVGTVVIGVVAVLLLLVLPALLLASAGRALWLAATLSGIAAIPAFVLGVGSVVGVVEHVQGKLRRR